VREEGETSPCPNFSKSLCEFFFFGVVVLGESAFCHPVVAKS